MCDYNYDESDVLFYKDQPACAGTSNSESKIAGVIIGFLLVILGLTVMITPLLMIIFKR